jgi:NAD(P)-dependent dehydrogenase (short-subunit alcohol dehydrogenase family)
MSTLPQTITRKSDQGETMLTQQPRVAMITGGNSGIGFATAAKLAAQGFLVILASRNQEASTQAIARIHVANPDASVESIPLDLASFASVRKCVATYHTKGYPLHLLINNAGGAVPGKQASFTADGFEMTLGTNHLGHFLFTNLLLDDLKRSAPARVITVSSRLHNPDYAGGPRVDFDYANLRGKSTTTRRSSTAIPNWRTCGSPMNCSAG